MTRTTHLDRALDALDYIARAANDPLPATLPEASAYASREAAAIREDLVAAGAGLRAELGQAAAFLFDHARALGESEGRDQATSRLAREHAAALLDLARIALERAGREEGDDRKTSALFAGFILGRTPMVVSQVSIALHAIGHRRAGGNLEPDVDLALQNVQAGLDELGGYR